MAGAFNILLDTFLYSYYRSSTQGNIRVAAVLILISAFILGGLLSQLLGRSSNTSWMN